MVRLLLMIMPIMLLVGCESIPFLSTKNQLESIVAVGVAGTYNVQVSKDGKVLITETWECTQDNGKLTGCHKLAIN